MLKNISIFVITVTLILGFASDLFAQRYPDHAITMVLPMAPGDALDICGRLAAEELSKLLKVPVIPVNKPGASATVGTDAVVKAKKDGYTILSTNSASLINTKILQPEIVPYDPFKDLAPLGLFNNGVFVLAIRSDAPYKTLKEVVEFAKANPGKLRCGTAGVSSISGFNVGLLKMLTGTDITAVPFKGAAPGVTALLGGEYIEMCSTSVTALLPHLRSRELKAIAISQHFPEFPDVPTLAQLGYKQNLLVVWNAFYAPARIPKEATDTLVPAIEKVVRDPTLSSKMAALGMFTEYLSPEKLLDRMREEYKMIEDIAKKFGMLK